MPEEKDSDSLAEISDEAMVEKHVSPQVATVNYSNKNNKRQIPLFTLMGMEQVYPELQQLFNEIGSMKNSNPQIRNHVPSRMGGVFRPLQYADSTLPAVQARGRMIELQSPFTFTFQNDGPPIKIPLKAQKMQGTLRYFSIPKEDNLVYLKASVVNSLNSPILLGQTQIFMNGDLIAKSNINTVSEQQEFSIDLGVDRNVETKRIVNKKSKENGVVFKDHNTEVNVSIEVVNNHDFPINIEIKDNYPRSPNDKIEVTLSKIIPETKDSKNGIITWIEKIKKRSKKVFEFSYNVKHPSNFIISEIN